MGREAATAVVVVVGAGAGLCQVCVGAVDGAVGCWGAGGARSFPGRPS